MNESEPNPTIPEPLARVAAHMAGFPAPWCLCGGWAVDAWLGRMTREHGDIDVSVFSEGQQLLFDHLQGWQLLAHGPAWHPSNDEQWWDGRGALHAGTHLHARGPEHAGPMPEGGLARSEDGFTVEFYLDDRSGADWVLSREPRITFPIQHAVTESVWGVPVAVPEIILLFKSRDLRSNDTFDFRTLLPQLAPQQRDWLRDAVSRLGHPWMSDLSRKESAR